MPPQSTQVGLAFHILIYIEVEGQKQKALWKRFQSRQALTLCSHKMPAARAPGRRPSGRDFSLVCTSALSGLIWNLELFFQFRQKSSWKFSVRMLAFRQPVWGDISRKWLLRMMSTPRTASYFVPKAMLLEVFWTLTSFCQEFSWKFLDRMPTKTIHSESKFLLRGRRPLSFFSKWTFSKCGALGPGPTYLRGPRAAFWKCSFLKLICTFGSLEADLTSIFN